MKHILKEVSSGKREYPKTGGYEFLLSNGRVFFFFLRTRKKIAELLLARA